MDNAKEYQEMLNMEASSCEVVVKPAKSPARRKKIKFKTIKRANGILMDSPEEAVSVIPTKTKKKSNKEAFKKKEPVLRQLKFDVISAQIAVIFVLAVTILLTNIFWEDSGMNVILKSVFNPQTETSQNYEDFTVYAPDTEITSTEDGVMTFSKTGAVYAPCEGVIESVVCEEDDAQNKKYTITIRHSDTFTSVISNVDEVYFQRGDAVYKTTPVCYTDGDGEVEITFYNGNEVLADYSVVDGVVEWTK